jgi:hypothetical protein
VKVFCYRSGRIEFTNGKTPDGALLIASGPARRLKEVVGVMARHGTGASKGVLLVPGIPEAASTDDAFVAWENFQEQVKKRMETK